MYGSHPATVRPRAWDSIDNMDASIIRMLAERFRCTQKVGVLKARHTLPPSAPTERRSKSPVSATLRLLLNLIQSLPKSFLAFVIREVTRIMKPLGAERAMPTRRSPFPKGRRSAPYGRSVP